MEIKKFKIIYEDLISGVKFTIKNIAGEQYKINPINLSELGLTSYTEFISLKDLDKGIKDTKLTFRGCKEI